MLVKCSWFKVMALVVTLALVGQMSLPSIAAAQDACMQGRMDAEAKSYQTWFWIGCIGGLIGLLLAYVIEPSPPATSLMGQPPEYVAAYTDCYKSAAKSKQGSKALTGCLVGTGISVALNLVLIAASD
jgi:hypothetical protein